MSASSLADFIHTPNSSKGRLINLPYATITHNTRPPLTLSFEEEEFDLVDALTLKLGKPLTKARDRNVDEVNSWLREKEEQLIRAKYLFTGNPISCVLMDPMGFTYPPDWYAHMLRYSPGLGLVKGEVNPSYMLGCAFPCCNKKAT